MLDRLEKKFRSLRRYFSRSHWLTFLFGLPVSEGRSTRPGLLLIQVDGLSKNQLSRALDQGEMPFLKSLIENEHYQVHTQYSGLPSSTPAVQGELFYGIKTAVPAFSFRDSETREIVRMYEPDAAEKEEKKLEATTEKPLLEGGSAYADIFTGGADEAHFCPSALGWGPTLRSAKALTLLFLLCVHLISFLRISVYLVLELVLAITDFFRGVSKGRNFIQELKFIPSRVAICILLRDLCVVGGKIDINRGLPVIHINFLGYDEQAHRRGAKSMFAHWALKGIDHSIARLWRAAHRAPRRHYEVWVYSDHGQCETRPYSEVQGYDIKSAVDSAFSTVINPLRTSESAVAEHKIEGEQTHRVRFLGGQKIQRLFSVFGLEGDFTESEKVQVTALGPVGFVYLPGRLSASELNNFAQALCDFHNVPAVIVKHKHDRLCAWTRNGVFNLPEQMDELFGEDHPFLDEFRHDLPALCLHPSAGDMTLLGWCKGSVPLTFAMENGSHAGLTHDETKAFCLLPRDTVLPTQRPDQNQAERKHSYLRPADLREAALHHLGHYSDRAEHKQASISKYKYKRSNTAARPLRVMTYNVHSCIGTDGKLSVERIARIIARSKPDVVALQELDVNRVNTRGEDQAKLIARFLEMNYHFHPAIHIEEEKYGDAILTHLPMRVIKSAALPGISPESKREPRGALWVAIDFHGIEVHVMNTHLGLSPKERKKQVQALLGDEWLGNSQCKKQVILCGDFNAFPSSYVCKQLQQRLDDAQIKLKAHRPQGTFYSRLPAARIDHIFADGDIEVMNVDIPRSELALLASDHLPLIADLCIPADIKQ